MSQSLLGTPATQLETLPSAVSITNRPAAQAIALESTAQQPPQSVAFVDTRLDQVDQLVAGIEADKVVLIDKQADGVEQITQTLAQYDSLSSVHIFSHGNPGSLQLGNSSLDSGSIEQYSEQLAQWGSALLGKADLMLYGCDLTGSESGLALVQQISDLTGADVAASDDTTGASELGGDWQLETQIGEIESAIALNQTTQAAYASTLDLITNGNFEADLANWDLFTGSETATTNGALNGKSLRVTAAAGGVGQIVAATPGEAYKITGSAKSSGTSGYTGTGINFLDADFNRISSLGTSVSNPNWTPYEVQGIADDDAAFVQVWAYKEGAGGVLSLDNLELTTTTIDPPPAAGEELLTNPGFENGLTAWNGISGTESVSTTANTGSQSLQLSGAASGANQLVDAVAGEDYTLSLFGRTQSPSYVGAGLNFFDADYNLLNFSVSNEIGISGNSWKSYQQSATAPNQTEYVQVWTYQDQANGNTFLDDISLSTSAEPTGSDFGNIRLEDSNITVSEADGTATLTVLRTDGSDGTITVDYGILAQSATAGEDFTPVSGTLTFADGETEKTVDVAIIDDNLAEGAESFGFAIDNAQGGATLLAPRTATVTITDNDSTVYRGNQYQLTSSAKTWQQAQAEAESLGGNLVTINAGAEEAFLKNTFGTAEGFWLGLNDANTEGSFEWASGESVGYTNWAPGEPNDFGSGQDYAYMNFSDNNQWDDLNGGSRLRGIIEIGDDNSPDDVTPGNGDGLLGEYYNNQDFTSPALNRVDPTVNFNWGNGSPAPSIGSDTFSARWTGQIEPLYSETYTFQTTTDDGVRLFVNDQLIIDKFIGQAPTAHTGTIQLNAGEKYDIRMEYYEQSGGAVARLAWSSASQPLQIVPQSQLFSAPAPEEEVLVTESVVTGLTQPTSTEWQPDSDRMFISEKGGVVKIFENGSLNADPFIDISDQVNSRRDRGLLDIAIHPNFPSTPYVYLLYTYDPPEVFDNVGTEAGPDGRNNRAGRLTRVTADASTNFTTAVPGSEVVLVGKNSTWDNFDGFSNSTFNFDVEPAGVLPDGTYQQDILVADSESHTVGGLAFGPDGALYLTNGDGASYNRTDPRAARTLDIDSLSGKVLRVDPITGAGLADNPFYDGDPDSNRSKVYQYGLRNPFRITVNEDDGELYIGDVGLSSWEEINNAEPGANFGWPFFEGGDGESLRTGGYRDLPEAIAFYNSGEPVEAPFKGFSRAESNINAIVLGDIYTGDAYPDQYKGDLFFNDLGQGIVRNISFDANGGIADIETFTTGANLVVHIEEGPDGALYYTDLDDGEVGRWIFSEPEAGQRSFVPGSIPPVSLPTVLEPELTPRGRQPAPRPDFFLAS